MNLYFVLENKIFDCAAVASGQLGGSGETGETRPQLLLMLDRPDPAAAPSITLSPVLL